MGCGRRFFRAVTGRSDWVIRGAYGVFYSHTVRQGREGILGFNPPFLVDNLVGRKCVWARGGRLRRRNPNQRTPYIQQFNFGIRRELARDLLLDVAYI